MTEGRFVGATIQCPEVCSFGSFGSFGWVVRSGTEKEEAIEKRLKNARREMERSSDTSLFSHLIVNDDLETTYAKIKVPPPSCSNTHACTHAHTHTHTFICVCTYMYLYRDIFTHTHTFIHTYIHTHNLYIIHTCIPTYTLLIYIQTCKQTYIYTDKYTYTHTNMQTYMYTYIYVLYLMQRYKHSHNHTRMRHHPCCCLLWSQGILGLETDFTADADAGIPPPSHSPTLPPSHSWLGNVLTPDI